MKKIVIIGASAFQCPLIVKAKERGYETHVFAWAQDAPGREIADFFYPISIVEKEEILNVCRTIAPNAITSIGSDLAVDTVNYVAHALDLPGNAPESTLRCTNKFAMRRALAAAGLPVPRFFLARTKADLTGAQALGYPLMVKPTDRSGSRGVTRVDTPDGLCAAFENAMRYSFAHEVVIEEFFEGVEYSCETISQHGKHHFLTITRKYTTDAPHFIETGHIQPCGLERAVQETIFATLFSALNALGIANGASHAEFRRNARGEICIIEIGARMGGDCIGSHLVPLSTGHDYVGYVLDVALGEAFRPHSFASPRAAAIRFIFSQHDLDILARAQKTAPHHLAFISEITPVGTHEIIDSATRCGYFIVACDAAKQAAALCELNEEEPN